MEEYINAIFWQVAVNAPKERASEINDFFMQAGALSSFELLYAEGKTANLQDDDTQLYFFFSENFPARALVPMALAVLGLTDLAFSVERVKYADYLKEFERSFRAFRLTEKTALVPPWDADNEEIAHCEKKIWLIPGMAFGTGKHATTQLMIEFIEKEIRPNDTVIDLGCGSGILAIAALIYGCQKAIGIDVETLAIESACDNLRLNEEKHNRKFLAQFLVGDFATLTQLGTDGKDCVFLANILPNIFEANAKALKHALENCRAWALSGIPATQEKAFSAFLQGNSSRSFAWAKKDDWLVYFFSDRLLKS